MRKGNMTILASILAIILVAVGVGAGSMAYFSDQETSSGNIFTAGTLDMSYTMSASVPLISTVGPLRLINKAPGYTWTQSITVTNGGTLTGYLYGRSSYLLVNNGGDGSDLADVLIVDSWTDNTGTISPDVPLSWFASTANVGPYSDPVDTTRWHGYGTLAPGASVTLSIAMTFDPTAGNEYQGDSIDVSFDLLLYQNPLGT